MSSNVPPIILYAYAESPYARRISWYLQLRGIPYRTCQQPPMLPRPDVAALGIMYRRIPLCALGRDIYLDTRLVLAKLEALLEGPPKLGASPANPEHAALERLLSSLTTTGGVFAWAVALLPAQLPIFRDPRWIADRSGFLPGSGKMAPATPAARAEAVANMRLYAALLETTLLADGRDWMLGAEEGPRLADIEAVWPLHWVWKIPGALPPDQLSAAQFPRVFAWVERFDRAASAAAARAGQVQVSGQDAVRAIVGTAYFEEVGRVRESESVVQALKLKNGDRVVVFPSDYGMSHKASGSLVTIDEREVVFETKTELEGSPTVRVHAPRLGFRIAHENQASHL